MLSQSQIRLYWSPRCTGPFATVYLNGRGRVTVRSPIVPAVKALDQVLKAYGYQTRAADTGAYNCRQNTSGTGWSMHAYGVAIDINWQSNPYSYRLVTDMLRYGDGKMPHRICMIKTNNGKQVWNWGGFWNGNKDAMHYEIVCTPADLRTGINWSTVYGGGTAPAPTPPTTTKDWFDMATKAELEAVVKAAEDRQNAWTRAEIDKAVAEVKRNNDVIRDSLAKLIRAVAAKLGVTGV